MRKFWKTKRTVLCAIVTLFLLYIGPVASAASFADTSVVSSHQGEVVSPRTEETTWYFRNYNGRAQKRLWSNTRGICLTDWIYC